MRNTSKAEFRRKKQTDEGRLEYKFDYAKSKPNRFAGRRSISTVVLLDKDVAKVFRSSDDVNSALRAIISALPGARTPRMSRSRE